MNNSLRDKLVCVALEWQKRYGVAPQITTAISEYDAARTAQKNEWNCLIWILYDKHYVMQEAWQWDVEPYRQEFDKQNRLSPDG